MNIAIFGGTFDPIHSGHLQVASVATRKFRLDRILFVPTGNPPHKVHNRLTTFLHRFAMVALACAADRRYIPSLLEAPRPDGRPHYSIATVRAVKKCLRPKDRLFFIVGMDALLDLPHWRQYRQLLDLVDFIVVSRPSFDSQAVWKVVPPEHLRPGQDPARLDTVRLRHSTLHVLRGVDVPVASHEIRRAIRAGRRVTGLVPPLVEQYIRKEGLYRPGTPGRAR